MKTSIATLALAAGLCALAPTAASAAIISKDLGDITLGLNDQLGDMTPSRADATVYTFETGTTLPTLGGATSDGGVADNQGTNTAPPVPDGDASSKFFSFSSTANPGLLTFNVAAGSQYFGLYWGSMDAFNEIIFLENGVQKGVVTGSDVVLSGTADGTRTGARTNHYVNITTDFTFDQIAFRSTSPAFESDNWAIVEPPPIDQGALPEPTPLLLVGGGLLALYLGLRRRAA